MTSDEDGVASGRNHNHRTLRHNSLTPRSGTEVSMLSPWVAHGDTGTPEQLSVNVRCGQATLYLILARATSSLTVRFRCCWRINAAKHEKVPGHVTNHIKLAGRWLSVLLVLRNHTCLGRKFPDSSHDRTSP